MTGSEHLVSLIAGTDQHDFVAGPRETLADVLRNSLDKRSVRVSCEQGICGTCTVLVNREPVRSCLVLAPMAEGDVVETLESFNGTEEGRLVAESFVSEFASQCGFCTPGFMALGVWMLRQNVVFEEAEIDELISSNICRCTGYVPIRRALKKACDTWNEKQRGRAQ